MDGNLTAEHRHSSENRYYYRVDGEVLNQSKYFSMQDLERREGAGPFTPTEKSSGESQAAGVGAGIPRLRPE